MKGSRLSHAALLELKRWNTPTIYNGWQQITACDAARECFNLEPVTDYMPHMGSMVGYAVTVVCEPSNPKHASVNSLAWSEYRRYVASIPGPKVILVQDLDKPGTFGSFWSEVNANIHRALGCFGTITDGAVHDVDEMNNAGFKALARRLCVGHAHVCPVEWNQPVQVFGVTVEPNTLIHADRHGFLAIPAEDEGKLAEAVSFMEATEYQTLIDAARNSAGMSAQETLALIDKAAADLERRTRAKFSGN